jgi:hypothetical protein
MKKLTLSFLHDADVSADLKIVALRRAEGFEATAYFWVFVENLRLAEDYRFKHSDIPALAYSLRADENRMQTVLKTCIEIGLFISDGTYFESTSLSDRMFKYDEKCERLKENGKQGGRPRKEKDESNQGEKTKEKPIGFENKPNANQEKPNDNQITNTNTNTNINLNTKNLDNKGGLGEKEPPTRKPKKNKNDYTEFSVDDFAIPTAFHAEAVQALKDWVEYKAEAGHPKLLRSYQTEINRQANEPELFVKLVERAVSNDWQGLNETLPFDKPAKVISANFRSQEETAQEKFDKKMKEWQKA